MDDMDSMDDMDKMDRALALCLKRVRACRRCAAELPLDPRPIVRARVTARILIVGQAPGLRVHQTGIPWNDPSGDRLRRWLGLDREQFYDESRIAIIPMGLCYPGRNPQGGDLPPRTECAPAWFPKLLPLLPTIATTILAGAYAQKGHLGEKAKPTLTETVRNWRAYAPEYFPLPHPSFRNNQWLKNNPWFEEELVPALKARLREILNY